MHYMVGTAICYGFCLGACGVTYLIKKHKDKQIEKWREEREAEKEREMIEIGYRIRNDMMREIALNSKITVKPRIHIKVVHDNKELGVSEYLEIEQQARERRMERMKNKRGKKLTAAQKKAMTRYTRLNPANWLCIDNNAAFFTIKHRESGNVKTIAY